MRYQNNCQDEKYRIFVVIYTLPKRIKSNTINCAIQFDNLNNKKKFTQKCR